ncbi:right-handed parallel beta-helix repeat-containing protein [Nocardioides caricicola]|uniref:Right-handed parallel beta-helix repeat-containing protein n=1 Tax=Nocardioides caricicola TaxID=634770 RepID=A0ABW0MTF3_9ACTN
MSGALLALVASTLPPAAAQASAPDSPRARTLVVGPHGSDSAAGTPSAPLRTIGAAISRAGSGSTIVVRGGQYHESLTIPSGKRLTIEAAPGDRPWIDGSQPVHGWRATADGFVHHGWRASFDSSPTYTWGASDGTDPGWSFVNPQRPMAAHPDQVWIGGAAQRQVSSRAQLRPGAFFVDERADRLYLGSDPAGRDVRASTLATALAIRASGTTIRGIGVRRFAPSVPHMGAVTVEARDVTLARVSVRGNATTGVHVMAPGVALRHVSLVDNGMLGLSATYADGLRLMHVRAQGNNTEGFNHAPVAGGIKIGRTRGVRVVGATATGNDGTGLWFDESTQGIRVLDSVVRDNDHHGISLEISDNARVVDTVIAGNTDDGVKVNNTSRVGLWNNTIVDNGRPVNIVQDERDGSDPDVPGHDPRRPVPAPGLTWINSDVSVHNNILGRGQADANCLLCVEDYSGRFSAAELGVRASGNVYARANRSAPNWVVVWSRGAGNPAVFTSVSEFARTTGQERPHLAVVGRPAVTRDLGATAVVSRAAERVAQPLPAALARSLGRPAGVRHLGAWVG